MLDKSFDHNRDYEKDYMYVVHILWSKKIHKLYYLGKESKWPNLIDKIEFCGFFKHINKGLSINDVSTLLEEEKGLSNYS